MHQNRYTSLAIALHWLVAVLMLGNIVLAWGFDWVPETQIRLAIDTHKSIGITVLGLAVLRILWRLGHRPPAWPQGALTASELRAAHVVHGLLYVLMVALPLSGWLHDSAWKAAESHPLTLFGLVDVPRLGWVMTQAPEFKERLHDLFGEAHELLAVGLYVLFAMHVVGALKHQWLDKQPTLERMSWRRR